ncbi:MAG TPA: AAA family ATPase [Candidatus Binataceae bacterium]|nr:AAA family ATPase [Candidatus Binataceae bacterium]
MSTDQHSHSNQHPKVIQSDRFFVITGGPGGGKTTLINKLRARGIVCVDEVGRAIIQTQMKIDGRGLPWVDLQLFEELMLQQSVANYLAADREIQTIFDRGIVDHSAGTELTGAPVPGHVRNAVDRFRYNPTVFIAPPWPEIYTTDAERRQDFAEAVRIHDAMVRAYSAEGYRLIRLPLVGVEERADFVLERIAAASPD